MSDVDVRVDVRALLLIGAAARLARRAAFDVGPLVATLMRHRAPLGAAFALSVGMQTLLAAAVFSGAHGWVTGIGYFDILFVLATAQVLQAVPISVAGVGAAEIAGTGLYVALGVPLPAAILLVSLLYGYRLLIAIGGGLWDLLPDSASTGAAPVATGAASHGLVRPARGDNRA